MAFAHSNLDPSALADSLPRVGRDSSQDTHALQPVHRNPCRARLTQTAAKKTPAYRICEMDSH
ncbi:unnamed protein product [Clonostachys solani]|uniref:Uncharacterized protein n=1 Tax=Clonostachys solani TaxID=160281 RepID=A0A9N9VXM4_9HYPO|nr:unnamed protein product [Clonostachys solani]